MPKEIERKFLVDQYELLVAGVKPIEIINIHQWYVTTDGPIVLRLREEEYIDEHHINTVLYWLTVKNGNTELERDEIETKISWETCESFLNSNLITKEIKKQRWNIKHKNKNWSIDFFGEGDNLLVTNFVLAEVELKAIDQKISVPSWVTEEVTGNSKYYNHNLAKPVKR